MQKAGELGNIDADYSQRVGNQQAMESVTDLKLELPQIGQVRWIGISRERRGEIESRDSVEVVPGKGIIGDHHAKRRKSKRQVTLIQYEHLAVIASLCGHDSISPEKLRRNIAVSGLNLLALKDQCFRIGTAILQGSGLCAPCSRMNENLGPGGYNAVRGHGGITAIVHQAGEIRIGDEVAWLPAVQVERLV